MPRVTDIAVVKPAAQHNLHIRARVGVEALPQLIGESYGKLAAHLESLGEYMCDIPYVCYHNTDMQDLDVEIGFPVARQLPGEGEILAGSIPAGLVACCLYRGPYREMEPVYAEMAAWMQKHGHAATGAVYEYYYNGPEVDESEYLTKIVFPIKN